MPAYVIAEIEVTDADAYEPYRTAAGPTVSAAGGRYIVRGGAVESLEGDPVRERIVVLEFPDAETARTWYHSPEYQAAAPIRQAASRGRVFLVEGYDPLT